MDHQFSFETDNILIHPEDYDPHDVVCNPTMLRGLREGDFVEITIQANEKKILFHATKDCFVKAPVPISVNSRIASRVDLQQRTKVTIRSVPMQDIELGNVVLSFRNQFLSRSDLYPLTLFLIGKVVHIGKEIAIGDMPLTVQRLQRGGVSVESGVVTEHTKKGFVSYSATCFWVVQLTEEIWDFCPDGDVAIEKFFELFLSEAGKIWNRMGCSHVVHLLFCSRVYLPSAVPSSFGMFDEGEKEGKDEKDGEDGEDGKDGSKSWTNAIQTDAYGDEYVDVFHWMTSGAHQKWEEFIGEAREVFYGLTRFLFQKKDLGMISNGLPSIAGDGTCEREIQFPSLPIGKIASARKGCLLEPINIGLDLFERHYIDRDMEHTGQKVAVFTCGTGVFEVDDELEKVTSARMMEIGVYCDLIVLGHVPMHVVPIFIKNPRMSKSRVLRRQSSSSGDSLNLMFPMWTNVSCFTRTSFRVGESTSGTNGSSSNGTEGSGDEDELDAAQKNCSLIRLPGIQNATPCHPSIARFPRRIENVSVRRPTQTKALRPRRKTLLSFQGRGMESSKMSPPKDSVDYNLKSATSGPELAGDGGDGEDGEDGESGESGERGREKEEKAMKHDYSSGDVSRKTQVGSHISPEQMTKHGMDGSHDAPLMRPRKREEDRIQPGLGAPSDPGIGVITAGTTIATRTLAIPLHERDTQSLVQEVSRSAGTSFPIQPMMVSAYKEILGQSALVNMHTSFREVERARWTHHLFPVPLGDSCFKWSLFSESSILPLTTEICRSAREHFVENSYDIKVTPFHGKDPEKLLTDIVSQRLQKGFQHAPMCPVSSSEAKSSHSGRSLSLWMRQEEHILTVGDQGISVRQYSINAPKLSGRSVSFLMNHSIKATYGASMRTWGGPGEMHPLNWFSIDECISRSKTGFPASSRYFRKVFAFICKEKVFESFTHPHLSHASMDSSSKLDDPHVRIKNVMDSVINTRGLSICVSDPQTHPKADVSIKKNDKKHMFLPPSIITKYDCIRKLVSRVHICETISHCPRCDASGTWCYLCDSCSHCDDRDGRHSLDISFNTDSGVKREHDWFSLDFPRSAHLDACSIVTLSWISCSGRAISKVVDSLGRKARQNNLFLCAIPWTFDVSGSSDFSPGTLSPEAPAHGASYRSVALDTVSIHFDDDITFALALEALLSSMFEFVSPRIPLRYGDALVHRSGTSLVKIEPMQMHWMRNTILPHASMSTRDATSAACKKFVGFCEGLKYSKGIVSDLIDRIG